jgi:hypothetical protein
MKNDFAPTFYSRPVGSMYQEHAGLGNSVASDPLKIQHFHEARSSGAFARQRRIGSSATNFSRNLSNVGTGLAGMSNQYDSAEQRRADTDSMKHANSAAALVERVKIHEISSRM